MTSGESFGARGEAINSAKNLESKGLHCIITERPGTYEVLVGPYQTFEELRRIHESLGTQDFVIATRDAIRPKHGSIIYLSPTPTAASQQVPTIFSFARNDRLTGATDFRTMTAAQTLEILKNADQVKVTRASNADTGKEWLDGCNGHKHSHFFNNSIEKVCYEAMGPTYDVKRPDAGILLQQMEALFRGCGIYALSSDDSSGGFTCGILGRTFYVIGNVAAARAVWESKGCYALDNVGKPVNGCMGYIVGRTRSATEIIGFPDLYHGTFDSSDAYQAAPAQLKLMARMACDSVHDRASCEYLIRNGENADMDAVRAAEQQEDNAQEELRTERAAEQQQRWQDFENKMAVLRSIADDTQSGIRNTTNQQVAQIQAIGAANDAARGAAQQRAAAGAQQQAEAARQNSAVFSQSGTNSQSSGVNLNAPSPAQPINVVFTHSNGWSQGHAHAVSTPPGLIDCPSLCSATLPQGFQGGLQVVADSSSIVHGVAQCAWSAGSTGMQAPGNTWGCPIQVRGGDGTPETIYVYVDAVGSNQSAPPMRNGLPSSNSTGAQTTYPNSGNGSGGGLNNGSGSNQGRASCTDMTNLVTATVKVASDGMVVGYLTNHSNQTLSISTTFASGGKPNKGQLASVTIRPGQTVGGEYGGIWAPSNLVDTHPPEIFWYAVPQSQANHNCSLPW